MSLIITPKAAAQVVHTAAESGEGQPVLRVAAKRDRDGAIDYAMGFDEPREEDTVSLQHGVRLLIAPTSMELLNDTVLDFVYIENEADPQFIFRNPNDPNYQAAT
ncbi:MAG: iron-sulfur cluster assembly accessory protein [Arenicellales bacterium]|nr:iron-sulfur cluster assembly accessory protein [Arenicellales bacterium]